MPPGSPNPDPVSDQKKVICHTRSQTWPLKSIPVFRPGGGHKTQHTYLHRQKLGHYCSYSFIIETTNTFIPNVVSFVNHIRFWTKNGQNLYPFSDQNGAKTIPFGVAHTCMAYKREYVPPWGATATMCNTR